MRRIIGLAGQYAAVDENLTGRENIHMVARLSHLSRKVSARRADELLEEFGLSDAGDRVLKTYSGGMRRRLDLAAALVANPPVLFLDEPTTGPRPAEPPGPVGRHRGAGARGHDRAAHHAVPRGGGPAGPRHRRDRPRARHRRGDAGPAQGRPRDLGGLGDPGRPRRRGAGASSCSRRSRRSRRSSRTSWSS